MLGDRIGEDSKEIKTNISVIHRDHFGSHVETMQNMPSATHRAEEGKAKALVFLFLGPSHSSLLTWQNMNVLVKRPQMKQSSETLSGQDHHKD